MTEHLRPAWRCFRISVLVPFVAAASALAPTPAAASTTVTCSHLHVTYSELYVGVAYPAAVFSSQCTLGGLPVASSGGGSFTIDSFPGPSAACAVLDECDHYDLSINIGPSTIHTVFDAGVDVYSYPVAGSPISNTVFDYGTAGAIIKFASGTGSGAINSVCRYDPYDFTENCTADGSFTWVA
jgi:hypothetical protein